MLIQLLIIISVAPEICPGWPLKHLERPPCCGQRWNEWLDLQSAPRTSSSRLHKPNSNTCSCRRYRPHREVRRHRTKSRARFLAQGNRWALSRSRWSRTTRPSVAVSRGADRSGMPWGTGHLIPWAGHLITGRVASARSRTTGRTPVIYYLYRACCTLFSRKWRTNNGCNTKSLYSEAK